ncbi:MAG: response regulator [Bacteroidota bacterium]
MSKKILLVDDDRDFITAIETMVRSQGYETKVAFSGMEGYIVAQGFGPDLIILDVNMETYSAGFDLNKRLRTNDLFKSTPIIMLTGIETMAATNQMIDMYNNMTGTANFETEKVMKVLNADGTVSVDYTNPIGRKYYLLLDSFLSKPVETEVLLKEIKKFLKD